MMTAETLWQETQRMPLSEQLKLAMLIIEQAQTAISSQTQLNPQTDTEDREEKLNALFGIFKDPSKAERIRAEWKRDFEREEEKFNERFAHRTEAAP